MSENRQPWLLVPAADLLAVCQLCRDDPELDFASLCDLTGWDLLRYPAQPPSDAIVVAYYLHSLRHRHHLTLKALAPRACCTLPSVSAIWPAAIAFEREVYDLLGVQFSGHPRLTRILLPEDWEGHPLRKDYAYPAAYHGVPHARAGQWFEDGPARAPAGAAPPAGGAA
ncbi:MAG: NADH-quinone oxidoreductase subunit C [Planctomycetota bacterium]|nr:NADH-quinone oxidoreductase subunit C [Planctomycetota bacterium]MCX8039455.1 NADH-quinone oxidoreductase subunit C [Planctomycetota bacterium]